MSNTSRVTPYESESSESNTVAEVGAGLAAVCVGAAAGAIALARWLSEETPEDRAAVDRLKAEQRRERLERPTTGNLISAGTEPLRLTTVNLHLQNPESLVCSAEKIGYRVIKQSIPLTDKPQILLGRGSGERLAIECNDKGRLTIRTAGHRRQIQVLVRHHTVDNTIEHFRSRGMHVQIATLSNGEVQIRAHERDTSRRGGAAEVKTQVRTDGTAWVDVNKVRGNRCVEIVSELAEAIGGQVSDMKKKNSYFQLPGEPTKVGVNI